MTEQENQLFYFEEDIEDHGQAEHQNKSSKLIESQSRQNHKQLYKIDDTNKISINFFERQNVNEAPGKDIILTQPNKKHRKEKKLSIQQMSIASNLDKQKYSQIQQMEQIKDQEKRSRSKQKTKTSIFWDDEHENQEQIRSMNKIQHNHKEQNIENLKFAQNVQTYEEKPFLPENQQKNQKKVSTKIQEQAQSNSKKEIQAQSLQNQSSNSVKFQTKIRFSEIKDMKSFLLHSIEKGKVLECTIKRDREGLNRLYPQFSMYTTDGIRFLMGAKKRSGNTTSNYLISIDRNNLESKGESYIGKLRSNWMGTQFIGYDSGHNPDRVETDSHQRREMCQIYYEANFMGARGPRVMDIYIPKYIGQQYPSNVNLKQLHEKKKESIRLTNRKPRWNADTKTFVLNFGNRVEQASVKNFILVQNDKLLDDKNCVLFGKVNSDVYSLDVRHPVSPLQAFQIALSSLDHKIACE